MFNRLASMFACSFLFLFLNDALIGEVSGANTCLAKSLAIEKSKPGLEHNAYARYCNEKYSFCLDYPTILAPQPEPDAHDGRTFKQPKSSLEMRAWGTYRNWTGVDSSILEQMQWTLDNLETTELPKPVVTYQAHGGNFFVISGRSGQKIFYQRTVLGGDTFATLYLVYPLKFRANYRQMVEHISHSLKILPSGN